MHRSLAISNAVLLLVAVSVALAVPLTLNTNLVVDGDCEAGVNANGGWTFTQNSFACRADAMATGAAFFFGGNFASSEGYQLVDATPHASLVDAGKLSFRARVRVGSFSGDSDHFRMWINFYNGGGTQIGLVTERILGYDTGASVLRDITRFGCVPPGTRSIRWVVRGIRNTGTELSGYMDDMELEFRDTSATTCPAVALGANAVFDADFEAADSLQSACCGWQNGGGNAVRLSAAHFPSATKGYEGGFGFADTTNPTYIFQIINLDGIAAQIDAAPFLVATLSAKLGGKGADADRAYATLEWFRDSDLTSSPTGAKVITLAEVTAASRGSTTGFVTRSASDICVPQGARRAVIKIFFLGVSGEYADGMVDDVALVFAAAPTATTCTVPLATNLVLDNSCENGVNGFGTWTFVGVPFECRTLAGSVGPNMFHGGNGANQYGFAQWNVSQYRAIVDAGKLVASLDLWTTTWDGDSDNLRVFTYFYDATGAMTGGERLRVTHDSTWLRQRHAGCVPIGTEVVEFRVQCVRSMGTECSGYMDDVNFFLIDSSSTTCNAPAALGAELVFNGNYEIALADQACCGWTATSGELWITPNAVASSPANIAAGGPSGTQRWSQSISLAHLESFITSSQTLIVNVSAMLGGQGGTTDRASVSFVCHSDAAHTDVVQTVTVGPVTAAQRSSTTSLLRREASECLVSTCRYALIEVTCTRDSGLNALCFSDDVSVVLSQSMAIAPAAIGSNLVRFGTGEPDGTYDLCTVTWTPAPPPLLTSGQANTPPYIFSAPAVAVDTRRQLLNISALAPQLDNNEVDLHLTAYLGGYLDQDDRTDIEMTLWTSADKTTQVGSAIWLLAPFAANRLDVSSIEFRERRLCDADTFGARFAELRLVSTRAGGTNNDGYADTIRLVPTLRDRRINLVRNGDAELGTIAHWLQTTPRLRASTGHTRMMAGTCPGSYHFDAGDAAASCLAFQFISLCNWSLAIDNGLQTYNFSAMIGGASTAANSFTAFVEFSALDVVFATSATLGPVSAADRENRGRFLYRSTTGTIPPRARAARVVLSAPLVSGTNLARIDDVRLVLDDVSAAVPLGATHAPPPPPSSDDTATSDELTNYLANPRAEGGTVGWTLVGSLQSVPYPADLDPALLPENAESRYFGCTSGWSCTASQTFALSGLESVIDAGFQEVAVSAALGSFAPLDYAIVHIEARSAANAVISAFKLSPRPASCDTAFRVTMQSKRVTLPPLTRNVVLRMEFVATNGSGSGAFLDDLKLNLLPDIPANMVENPSFTNGLASWTSVRGKPGVTSLVAPHQVFFGGNQKESVVSQDLPMCLYERMIDGGRLNLTVRAKLGGYGPQDDYTEMRLQFFNHFGTLLSEFRRRGPTRAQRGSASVVLQYTDIVITPVGTRRVTVQLFSFRAAGTSNDGYATDIEVIPQLGDLTNVSTAAPTPATAPPLPPMLSGTNRVVNGGFELNTTGWSGVATGCVSRYGTSAGLISVVQTSPDAGQRLFGAGTCNLAQFTISQNITIPSEMLATVEADAQTVVLAAWLGGFGWQADRAEVAAEFINGTDEVVGVLTLGPPTPCQRSMLTTMTYFEDRTVLPNDTVKIRVVISGKRTVGTVNDAMVDDIRLIFDPEPTPVPGSTPAPPAPPAATPAPTPVPPATTPAPTPATPLDIGGFPTMSTPPSAGPQTAVTQSIGPGTQPATHLMTTPQPQTWTPIPIATLPLGVDAPDFNVSIFVDRPLDPIRVGDARDVTVRVSAAAASVVNHAMFIRVNVSFGGFASSTGELSAEVVERIEAPAESSVKLMYVVPFSESLGSHDDFVRFTATLFVVDAPPAELQVSLEHQQQNKTAQLLFVAPAVVDRAAETAPNATTAEPAIIVPGATVLIGGDDLDALPAVIIIGGFLARVEQCPNSTSDTALGVPSGCPSPAAVAASGHSYAVVRIPPAANLTEISVGGDCVVLDNSDASIAALAAATFSRRGAENCTRANRNTIMIAPSAFVDAARNQSAEPGSQDTFALDAVINQPDSVEAGSEVRIAVRVEATFASLASAGRFSRTKFKAQVAGGEGAADSRSGLQVAEDSRRRLARPQQAPASGSGATATALSAQLWPPTSTFDDIARTGESAVIEIVIAIFVPPRFAENRLDYSIIACPEAALLCSVLRAPPLAVSRPQLNLTVSAANSTATGTRTYLAQLSVAHGIRLVDATIAIATVAAPIPVTITLIETGGALSHWSCDSENAFEIQCGLPTVAVDTTASLAFFVTVASYYSGAVTVKVVAAAANAHESRSTATTTITLHPNRPEIPPLIEDLPEDTHPQPSTGTNLGSPAPNTMPPETTTAPAAPRAPAPPPNAASLSRAIFDGGNGAGGLHFLIPTTIAYAALVVLGQIARRLAGPVDAEIAFEAPLWRVVARNHVWLSVLLPCHARCAAVHACCAYVACLSLYALISMLLALTDKAVHDDSAQVALVVTLATCFYNLPRPLLEYFFRRAVERFDEAQFHHDDFATLATKTISRATLHSTLSHLNQQRSYSLPHQALVSLDQIEFVDINSNESDDESSAPAAIDAAPGSATESAASKAELGRTLQQINAEARHIRADYDAAEADIDAAAEADIDAAGPAETTNEESLRSSKPPPPAPPTLIVTKFRVIGYGFAAVVSLVLVVATLYFTLEWSARRSELFWHCFWLSLAGSFTVGEPVFMCATIVWRWLTSDEDDDEVVRDSRNTRTNSPSHSCACLLVWRGATLRPCHPFDGQPCASLLS